MRVLVAYGSKNGGTAGLARMIGTAALARGVDVEVEPAAEVRDVTPFDAVVVVGALYANRWHRDARRFVRRCSGDLARMPVWLASSGPLDDSAAQRDIPPVPQVRKLMELVGARGHVTFGGYLAADVTGFPASAMAKTRAGDWRDATHVARWTEQVVGELLSSTVA